MVPPAMNDVPTRYAIQKARGSGWKTLEVGEDLNHVRARFQAMCRANAKAYFRIVSLDPLPNASTDADHEFTWKLIELRDPNAGGPPSSGDRRARSRRGETARARPRTSLGHRPRARERVRIPFRVYLVVIALGLLIGAVAYLRPR